MTSAAFAFRASWQHRRSDFYAALGLNRQANRILIFGASKQYDMVPPPSIWMPTPYLGFPAGLRDRFWDWVTRGETGRRPHYRRLMRHCFCDDLAAGMPVPAPHSGRFEGSEVASNHGLPVAALRFTGVAPDQSMAVLVSRHANLHVRPGQLVKEGDVIANDRLMIGNGWEYLDYSRWRRELPRLLPWNRLEGFLRLWFRRQFIDLTPGFVHLPVRLALTAACRYAVRALLYWDVTAALPYFDEACEAFVFPTLRIRRWDDFSGKLPGEVLYDLTPTDPRFVPRCKTRRIVSQATEQ